MGGGGGGNSLKDEATAYVTSLLSRGIVLDGQGDKVIRIAFPPTTLDTHIISDTLRNEYGATTIDQRVHRQKNDVLLVYWEVTWSDPTRQRDSILTNVKHNLTTASVSWPAVFGTSTSTASVVSSVLLAISIATIAIRVWEPLVDTIAILWTR